MIGVQNPLPYLDLAFRSQSGEQGLLPMGSGHAQTFEPGGHHADNVSWDSHPAHGSATQGVFLMDPCNGVPPLEGCADCAGQCEPSFPQCWQP